MAYNIMAVTAAKDTFVEWEGILTESLGTLEYSENFVNATIQAGQGSGTAGHGLQPKCKRGAERDHVFLEGARHQRGHPEPEAERRHIGI